MSDSEIEDAYCARIDAMTPVERVARAQSIYNWTRETIGRQIEEDRGPMKPERLKWEVALRLYGSEPIIVDWIEGILARVPD
ncbi:MAG TPA: hypothetical protein EYG03_15675 [Planctomycetes bacterium]|nr:hypothetical protein [Fuerstiella sp.]HIK93389.1 hypothetical protein [Planctomycetota bacterium]